MSDDKKTPRIVHLEVEECKGLFGQTYHRANVVLETGGSATYETNMFDVGDDKAAAISGAIEKAKKNS